MTIHELAEKAGVSIGTVDRVIHHRGRVAPETVARIEALVAESGYKPNPLARQLKLNTNHTIAVLLPALGSESGYWKLLYSGIEGAAAELAPFPVSIELGEFDRSIPGDCLRAGKELLKRGCVAFIIAPVMRADMQALVPLLGERPYVFVDSPLPGASPLATVAQNPYNGGFCAGRIMDLLCPALSSADSIGDGKGGKDADRSRSGRRCFLSIQMHAGTYNLAERSRGFASYFKDSADVVGLVWRGGSHAAFLRFMDEALKSYPEAEGIFVTNDAVFRVAAWLHARENSAAPACAQGKRGAAAGDGPAAAPASRRRIRLVGYDLLPENRKALLSGGVDCIISQCADIQGRAAVNTIYRSELLRQKTEEKVPIPIEIYFKENLA